MSAAEKGNLEEYRRKRDFNRTPEPSGEGGAEEGNIFVVQKHAASHLHYDFRLRLHGALKSWALPKGPSLDPTQHRLASETEDHPLEYARFEGVIPAGEYGGGTVMVWDIGEWEPLEGGKQGYYQGRLHFVLHGQKLRGRWTLTREDRETRSWRLVKDADDFASPNDILARDRSVMSGRTMEDIAEDRDRLWSSTVGEVTPPVFGHALGGALPSCTTPQPATLVDQVPQGDEWLHEIKYDGYRMVCRIDKEGTGVRFFTRRGIDFTDRIPTLQRAVARLPVRQAWLDGEIVVFTSQGRSDFHALQEALRSGREGEITYVVFDLMNYEGYDIRGAPLSERKAILADLVPPQMEQVRYVDHVVGHGEEFYREVCSRTLEGIVSKQADSGYVSEPSRRWLKVKCSQRQEFVVGGYTESGAGRPFGSLLAGYYDQEGHLVFAGKIKSGYSISSSETLLEVLSRYEQPEPPFVNPPSGQEYRNPHWVRPELVAEVAHGGISGRGMLRNASFKGLREDKPSREVRLEIPERARETAMQTAPPRSAKKDLPVFPHERLRREDLVSYYTLVADLMLPHIVDRPLTLIACPTNIYRCQFKKHATNFPPPVRPIDIAGHAERYLAVDDAEGVLTLVRQGSVEFHAWQSRYADLEHPDRLLFDLDPPEEGYPWEDLAEAALLLKIHLQERGLESFLQTTGGKGYYLVAPLDRSKGWKEVTAFARRISEEMEESRGDRFTAKLSKSERQGRIYVDWMRNGRGAHGAEPYSVRARPGAPVATPIGWEELVKGVKPDSFSVLNMKERLERLERDPWEGFFAIRQTFRR
ncbi:DNA ligase D [Geomonas sp. RF6]|uniref:DNA ligase D n=1 Tax=Geomonas sp. RF6 TaxID=2897342 RepID=UPI001E498099|nr:DNA ligase D [Geomonas sp. RF6]UFS71153.1 DNA ligase D [Geomonas sp. RF6]